MKIDPSHGRFRTFFVLEHRSLLSQKRVEGQIVMLGVANGSQNDFIPMIILPEGGIGICGGSGVAQIFAWYSGE